LVSGVNLRVRKSFEERAGEPSASRLLLKLPGQPPLIFKEIEALGLDFLDIGVGGGGLGERAGAVGAWPLPQKIFATVKICAFCPTCAGPAAVLLIN
jgi:hypothetical protein